MWLPVMFISLVGSVSSDNFHSSSLQRNPFLQQPSSADDGLRAIAEVQHKLRICIGDHHKILLSYPPLPDFNTLESIPEMLDLRSTNADLADLYLQAGVIASVSKLATVTSYETTLDDVLQQMKKGFRAINWALRDIEIFFMSEYLMRQYDICGNKRMSIRSLRNSWAAWTLSPSYINAYEELLRSCVTNDMSKWFATFNVTQYNRILSYHDRYFLTSLARMFKSDMCEAAILLGACDAVLNVSDLTKNEHMTNVISVYKEFAIQYTEWDKQAVTKAREHIYRTADNLITPPYRNVSYAESLKRDLKRYFYWLDFTVIVFKATGRRQYVPLVGHTEYCPDAQCPCVIPLQYHGVGAPDGTDDDSGLVKGIVFVSRLFPKPSSYLRTWSAVERVVKYCNATEKNCDAREFFDNTTDVNGGIRVASYFATTYSLHTGRSYLFQGPTGLAGRVKEVKTFKWNARFGDALRPVTVVAAVPCDRDIYDY